MCLAAAEKPLPEISLAPENQMGARGVVRCKEIIWMADSPWFTKPAPVCRFVVKPFDDSKILAMAKANGITQEFLRKKGEYRLEAGKGSYAFAACRATDRCFGFGPQRDSYDFFERDAKQNPIVGPLPTNEEAVALCREWMARMGVAEDEFHRQGDGPACFDTIFRIDLVRKWNYDLKKDVEYPYGMTVIFVQQIGGLPAFWCGAGGNMEFRISDGPKLSSAGGCLRGWEKIGDYPVLCKDGIADAIRSGFCWSDPVDCDKLEVTKVRLEAFHAPSDQPQKDFPLLYVLSCRLVGGADNGYTAKIVIPALRQHRDKYGPPPSTSSGAKIKGEKEPASKPKMPAGGP